jgi:hypothetical protein
MTAPSPQEQNSGNDRLPRLAVWVVAIGLLASAVIYGISFLPGSGSVEVEWDTVEEISAPAEKRVGRGTFELARPTLSALAPNEEGLLLYRVAGVVRVDSRGSQPTTVRCDIYSMSDDDTRIARSSKLRTAWPRPSDELQKQDVPETSYAKFATEEAKKVDLPIRDVARRYTDSIADTTVDWDDYNEDYQTWIWEMKNGTGVTAASMPFVVIFEASDRPRGLIDCEATIGRKSAETKVPFRLREWPIEDDQPNAGDADTGDVSNVE